MNIGDKVRLITDGRTGVVTAIYHGTYGAGTVDVDMDDGAGIINFYGSVCEPLDGTLEVGVNLINETKKCHCGVASVNGNKHSDYCPLYQPV